MSRSRICVRVSLFFIVSGILFSSLPTRCEEPPQAQSADSLVESLIRICGDQFTAETDDICAKLRAMQDEAVPAIASHLKELDGAQSGEVGVLLMATLHRIGTPKATMALLDIAIEYADMRMRSGAQGYLCAYPNHCPLTKEQVARIVDTFEKRNGHEAARMASILANCRSIPLEDRFHPIIDRFLAEIKRGPEKPDERLEIPFAMRAMEYLRAFANLGGEASGLAQKARKAASNEEEEKWLLLAQGMTGDSRVADAIRGLIEEETNGRVRWAAVRAYARSAKASGIPFLETLLNDKTEMEPWLRPGVNESKYYIANIAKAELAQLKRGIEGVAVGKE